MAKRSAKSPVPVVFDFETHPILERPDYPPRPVGVSIQLPGKKPAYYAFGHPEGNSCSEAEAKRRLYEAYDIAKSTGGGLLCHHAKFDMDVAEEHWGLKLPPWELIHDTMFLLFLEDPYSPDLQLKPAAERILGMKPEESDALLQWAISQKLLAKNAKKYGHLICKMPGGLVGKYADGDVIRTAGLFKKLHARVVLERGMGEAYDRERRLLPILLRNEQEGVQADGDLLKKHDLLYTKAMETSCAWVGKALKCPGLNLDAPKDLLAALLKSGKADESKLLLTPSGDLSASKDSLLAGVSDKRILAVMQYQSKLATALTTFIKPWRAQAEATKGGTVHPSWNQVRQHGAKGSAGAKTGRLSASRFMNVPKEYEEEEGKYEHPRFKGLELPELPSVRLYLLPDKKQVWLKRDFSQQELRVLGHFDDGALMQMFLDDFHGGQSLDVHQMAGDMLINMFGLFGGDRKAARKACKTIGFGLLYGMGLGALAIKLGTTVEDTKLIKKYYLQIFPGLADLQSELQHLGRSGDFITTWGGRQYFVEPPAFSKKFGRDMTFEYKLLNFLIQGSSADVTKEALITYDAMPDREGRFQVMVHDEINVSVPPKAAKRESERLRQAMAGLDIDVPLLSDAEIGPSWGQLKDVTDEPRLNLGSRYQ